MLPMAGGISRRNANVPARRQPTTVAGGMMTVRVSPFPGARWPLLAFVLVFALILQPAAADDSPVAMEGNSCLVPIDAPAWTHAFDDEGPGTLDLSPAVPAD